MMHSLLFSSLSLLNNAESVILGSLKSFVLLASLLTSLEEQIETLNLIVVGHPPHRGVRIVVLIDGGVVCALLEPFLELILSLSLVVLNSELVLFHFRVQVKPSVSRARHILFQFVDKIVGLGRKGCFLLFLDHLLGEEFFSFGVFNLILDFILVVQELDNVLGHCLSINLSSVFGCELVAVLVDDRLGVNVDSDHFHRLFTAFEMHAVDIQVFEVSEDLLLATTLHNKFTSLVDHAELEEGLALVVFVLVKFEFLLPLRHLSPPNDQKHVEQIFDGDTAIGITFQKCPQVPEVLEVSGLLRHRLRQEAEGSQNTAAWLVGNGICFIPLLFLSGHIRNHDSELALEPLNHVLGRLCVL